jgi:hypothetical protein
VNLLMIKDSIKSRKFNRAQRVSFIGGEGIIKNFRFDSGAWIYLIEMPLDPKPDFGRIGAEATILLNQEELHAA